MLQKVKSFLKIVDKKFIIILILIIFCFSSLYGIIIFNEIRDIKRRKEELLKALERKVSLVCKNGGKGEIIPRNIYKIIRATKGNKVGYFVIFKKKAYDWDNCYVYERGVTND